MNCMNRGTVGSLVDIANIVHGLNHGTQIIVVDEIVFHTFITAFFFAGIACDICSKSKYLVYSFHFHLKLLMEFCS
jgi:hypothetical protein